MFEPIYHPETICVDGIWDADQFGQVISDQNTPAVAGRVGQMTAGRARGFGMEIHYRNRTRMPAPQDRVA